MKVTVQNVICQTLRVCCVPRAAVVGIFNRGLYVSAAADPQCTLMNLSRKVQSENPQNVLRGQAA